MLRGSSPAAAVALALPQIPPGDMKKMHNMLPFRGLCFRAAVLALAMTAQVDGLVQQYCSSQNTGSSFGVGECAWLGLRSAPSLVFVYYCKSLIIQA